MSPKPLFLDSNYTIDGLEVTGEDLKNALIDQAILRNRIRELFGVKE